ncbi:hypothetical protein HPK19_25680 (plasmid) [Arthrobacter citreus]|nr:hypothetical protein HPK19_25680 [Arthrobacter citreus]
MLMPFNTTVDRLTLIGQIKDIREFRRYLDYHEHIDIGEQRVTNNGKYTHSGFLFLQKDGQAFFEVDLSDEGLDKFERGVNEIRLDFNPKWASKDNHLDRYEEWADLVAKVYREFIGFIDISHFSRIDVAFDFDRPFLNEYKITDTKPNRGSRPYIKNGIIETYEFGARGSALQVVAYDKKKERKDKNAYDPYEDKEQVHRLEVRLSKKEITEKVLDDWTGFNPFDGIVFADLKKKKLDFETYCKVKTLIDEPQHFAVLHRNTRTKFKKLIRELQTSEVDFGKIWEQAKTPIKKEIEAWTCGTGQSTL